MQRIARGGFTREEVIRALQGRQGSRTLSFRYLLLNENDEEIRDITPLIEADSAEVSIDKDAEIHRTAKFRVRDDGTIDFLKHRIQPLARVWIPPKPTVALESSYLHHTQQTENRVKRVREEGAFVEFPLGVFLLSTPERGYEGDTVIRDVEGYDKLQILVDDGFNARVIADEGERVTDFIRGVLEDAGITKMNIPASDKVFPTWMSWDPDTSRLEVVNELLEVINYERLHVDENGFFISRPYRTPTDRGSDYTYQTDEWSLIEEGATATEDLFNVPNEWIGLVSEPDRVPLTYTYRNEEEDSPTSIPNRGRVITRYVDSDSVDLETLAGEVKKEAYEDSQVAVEMSFSTAIMPMHSYNDVFRVRHDKLGVQAKVEEIAWTMPLSASGSMSHEVREIVNVGGDEV